MAENGMYGFGQAVKKTRYINLSKLHKLSATYKFQTPHKRDFDDQNNFKSSVKSKKDPILEMWTQVKRNKKTFIEQRYSLFG